MKIEKEVIDRVAKEVALSFTRNGLALFGFDATGMVFLQAAKMSSDVTVEQVQEQEFGDGEIVFKELFEDWSVGQLTTRAGIKKLVSTIAEALEDPEYSESTIYEGSTKIQLLPVNAGQVKVNLIYIRERNV